MSDLKRIIILGVLFLFLLACAGPSVKTDQARGIYHRIKKGETLYSISKAYHANLQDLAELNNITNTAAIEVGDVIFIPGAEQVVDVPIPEPRENREPPEATVRKTPKPVSPSSAQVTSPASPQPAKKIRKPNGHPPSVRTTKNSVPVEKSPPVVSAPSSPPPEETKAQAKTEQPPAADQDRIEFDRKRFIWPVKGQVLARYGIQPNGLKNNGIRIAAGENTPVLAAAAGEVTYSDTLKYYGDTIILRHDDNFSTVYTSLKSRIVKVGDQVKKGDKIALLGKNDTGSQPYLNFEIRQVNKPRNPLFFLP